MIGLSTRSTTTTNSMEKKSSTISFSDPIFKICFCSDSTLFSYPQGLSVIHKLINRQSPLNPYGHYLSFCHLFFTLLLSTLLKLLLLSCFCAFSCFYSCIFMMNLILYFHDEFILAFSSCLYHPQR